MMTNRNSRAYIDSDVFTRRYMYSTINNMGKRNKYTSWENESPVGPPMWNDPLENVSSQLPPFVPMPGREIRLNPSVYTERVLRRPVNPFPDGDPDLSIIRSQPTGRRPPERLATTIIKISAGSAVRELKALSASLIQTPLHPGPKGTQTDLNKILLTTLCTRDQYFNP